MMIESFINTLSKRFFPKQELPPMLSREELDRILNPEIVDANTIFNVCNRLYESLSQEEQMQFNKFKDKTEYTISIIANIIRFDSKNPEDQMYILSNNKLVLYTLAWIHFFYKVVIDHKDNFTNINFLKLQNIDKFVEKMSEFVKNPTIQKFIETEEKKRFTINKTKNSINTIKEETEEELQSAGKTKKRKGKVGCKTKKRKGTRKR